MNILLLASHLKMPEAHSNLERETERDRERQREKERERESESERVERDRERETNSTKPSARARQNTTVYAEWFRMGVRHGVRARACLRGFLRFYLVCHAS